MDRCHKSIDITGMLPYTITTGGVLAMEKKDIVEINSTSECYTMVH